MVFHARRGTHDVLEVGFSALARASHRADRPLSDPRAGARRRARRRPGTSPRRSAAARKPLDIQITATDAGLDVDVRGSGPLTSDRIGRARPRRRASSPGTPDAPRRTRRAARGPDRDDGSRPRRAAARRLPAGDRRGRGRAGAARAGALRRGEDDRRPVRRRRAVCVAARRARPRHGGRQRRGGDRGLAARGRRPRKVSSRSTPVVRDLFRRPFVPVELKPFDCVVFDPPRQGAAGAGARACRQRRAADRRGVVQSGDVRARCPHSGRRRLPADCASRRSTSFCIRRTSNWSRAFAK